MIIMSLSESRLHTISYFLLGFGASLYSRAAANSCQVDASWWTNLVEICNCEDLNDPNCSLSLVDTPTSAMSCKVDSEQLCKNTQQNLSYLAKPFATKLSFMTLLILYFFSQTS